MTFKLKNQIPYSQQLKINKITQILKKSYIDDAFSDCQSNKYSIMKKKIDKDMTYTLFKNMEEWGIKIFQESYKNQKYPLIVLQISHFIFHTLRKIMLDNSKILSVEPFCWMDCPHLLILSLRGNRILSLKPFSKCCFKNLFELVLTKNPSNHYQSCHLSRLRAKQLSSLFVFFSSYSQEGIDSDSDRLANIENLLKIQSDQISNCIFSLRKISKNIQNAFINRFSILKNFWYTNDSNQE